MQRYQPLDPKSLTGRQKEVYDAIASGPRGGVRGPFEPLLKRPDVADCVQNVGASLRFAGGLPGRLRELAILTTARFWSAHYEWSFHAPIAEKEGVHRADIEAIARRGTPDFDRSADKAIHDFCKEILETHEAGEETYAAAVDVLGADAVVELTVLVGYYSLLALVLNVYWVKPEKDTGSPPLGD